MKLSTSIVVLACLSATGLTANTTTKAAPVMVQLSTDSDFHFELLRGLTAAVGGGSDIGEVLTAALPLIPGNFTSWYTTFDALANRVWTQAQAIDSIRFPISARDAMFRAATYFRTADFYLHDAFNKAIALLPVPGKRVTLQADGFQVPAIFYAPPGVARGGRPTIIIGNGYDGSQEESYHQAAYAVVQRGWNAITYEGPGQPTVRRDQGLGFIVEWEKVVTPVVDYLFTLPEVDTSAIALMGLSFGGFLAPRAAAFEHRLAAVIALDGLSDFGPLFLKALPAKLVNLFDTGNQTTFDFAINQILANQTQSTQLRWIIEQGMFAFDTTSPFNFMTQIQNYTLHGVVDKIKTPLFSGDAQDDMFFTGQGKILAGLVPNSTYYQFLIEDGAGEHAGIGATVMQNQVVCDWFQNLLDEKK